MKTLLLISALFITSCATIDRSTVSNFQMTSSNTWIFKAKTAINYKKDDPDHEKIRINWLNQYTSANNCPNYKITSRVWTKEPTDNFIRTGFSDDVGLLVYKGECI